MPGQGGGGFLEDVLIAGGLLLVQCIVAGYIVFVGHLLALGADPLAIIVVAEPPPPPSSSPSPSP